MNWTIKREFLFAIFSIIIVSIFIGIMAFSRSFFSFGTETDYLGSFLPDAQRLLEGKPLLLKFHPPLYSIVLAPVQIFVRDWFKTGLIISLVSSVVALGSSFLFFHQLCGKYAGWGAILGMVTSNVFLAYSASATSDIFFLALYYSALLIALLSVKSKSKYLWVLCGLVIGCILLSRSNGITLLLIGVVPYLLNITLRQKLKFFVYLVLGILIPLIIWICFALISNSPLTPSNNHLNIAMTYFSNDGYSGDRLLEVGEKFENYWQVFTFDPIHLVKEYCKNFYYLLSQNLTKLINYPLIIFVLPGIILLIFSEKNRFFLLYFVLTISQVLLVGLMAYNDRFYLFLVPLFGAAIGEFFHRFLDWLKGYRAKNIFAVFMLLCSLIAFGNSYKVWLGLHHSYGELSEAVPQVRQFLTRESTIISRKPHLGFYSNSNKALLPNVETFEELRNYIDKLPNRDSLFLYYGTIEQDSRPQFLILKDAEDIPSWLDVVARSQSPDGWVLYMYKTEDNQS